MGFISPDSLSLIHFPEFFYKQFENHTKGCYYNLLRGTGNGERVSVNGNWEPGTGIWKRVYSCSPPDNAKWRTEERRGEKYYLGKCEKVLRL